jgi:acetyl-CoA acyltransferase
MATARLAGVGMTRFARHRDLSVKQLVAQAVTSALADAGLQLGDVDAAIFGNVSQGPIEGQYSIPGQIALRSLGLQRIPVVNVENACATGSTAFHLAAGMVRGGADVVLAVGVEKMVIDDKQKSLSLFEAGWDVQTQEENFRKLCGDYFTPGEAVDTSRPHSRFMDIYGVLARHHMETYGTTQRQLALVAAKNHWHSTFNPLAQYRNELSVDEILAAPRVSGPLTVPMCAPVSDGAAAAVLVSPRRANGRSLEVAASVLRSGSDRDPRDFNRHLCRLAAADAYAEAGLGPDEIDLAEVHDAAVFGEILQTECLGFCPPGEGGVLAERGETRLGGSIPINPSGGLVSKGHPLAATGLGQLYEIALQLRGEAGARQVDGARVGIAENGGGVVGVEEAAACITILRRN